MACKKAKKTEETATFLKEQGYNEVEMRECTFRNKMRYNSKLKAFIESRQPPTPQRQMTEKEILHRVVDGFLFGMVEVDIHVPDQWSAYYQHQSMTPNKYFQEMSPLFCTFSIYMYFDLIRSSSQRQCTNQPGPRTQRQ